MKLNQLTSVNKSKKRIGRGNSGKCGTTAGRGMKGQKSRSGFNIPKRFEGGQTSLIQRLPKKGGFKSLNKKPQIVKISLLEKKFNDNDKISPETLFAKKIISSKKTQVKILFDKKISKKFVLKKCKVSSKAKEYFKLSVK